MIDVDFNDYFNNSDNKYYDSKFIIKILEDILDKGIGDINSDIDNCQITVTQKQIREYLKQKLTIENPDLKYRMEHPKPKRNKNFAEWTSEDIENASQEFADEIDYAKYDFDPYTLEYFNKYTSIVKNKIYLLLKIIERIGNKNTENIDNILLDLDIILDKDGNILKSDIIRLITPTIYNINDLNEKISKANNLSTYLTFKMSKHSLYREGISENEIYPIPSIQTKDLYYDYIQGNVRLSEKQKEKLKKEQDRNMKQLVRILNDLD